MDFQQVATWVSMKMGSLEHTKHYHSRDGFTLIEIMLVLVLIAILSSITMPSLRGFAASTRLKSSARAIRDMLSFARDVAITERLAYIVVFDLDLSRFWLASSETFDAADPTTSSIASPSSTALQVTNQQATQQLGATMGQRTISRTSMILGVPQKLSHNVGFSRMTTNHNFQPHQANSGVDYIYFSPTGSAEGSVLYVQDNRGKAMSITVESTTGRVRLQEVNNQQIGELGLFVEPEF